MNELSQTVGIAIACQTLQVARSQFYRAQPAPTLSATPSPARPTPPRALAPLEKEQVRAWLDSVRFQDQAPREVYATLLAEGTYQCLRQC